MSSFQDKMQVKINKSNESTQLYPINTISDDVRKEINYDIRRIQSSLNQWSVSLKGVMDRKMTDKIRRGIEHAIRDRDEVSKMLCRYIDRITTKLNIVEQEDIDLKNAIEKEQKAINQTFEEQKRIGGKGYDNASQELRSRLGDK